jgi:hypothetical protein
MRPNIALRVHGLTFKAAHAALGARGVEHRLYDHDLAHSILLEDRGGYHLELMSYEH